MNYKKNYYDFISSRKNMNREKLDGNIYELHHILPRSLGGLDNKENLILLSPREHFLAHIMLYKIYGRGPMLRALFIMLSSVNNKEKKFICEDTKETYKSMSEICKKYKKSQGCASIELKKNGFVMIDNNKFRRINDGK